MDMVPLLWRAEEKTIPHATFVSWFFPPFPLFASVGVVFVQKSVVFLHTASSYTVQQRQQKKK